jgi:hypothetical protein
MARQTRPRIACKSSKEARISSFRQWVQITHQAFQALFQNMRVNLRGRNIGVAEQRLHHAQIGAVVEKVAGESVAQHVRADLRGTKPCGSGESFQFAGKMLAREMTALTE